MAHWKGSPNCGLRIDFLESVRSLSEICQKSIGRRSGVCQESVRSLSGVCQESVRSQSDVSQESDGFSHMADVSQESVRSLMAFHTWLVPKLKRRSKIRTMSQKCLDILELLL